MDIPIQTHLVVQVELSVMKSQEYAEVDENNTILSCNFGITELGSTSACDVPCDTDAFYNCTCVSKSVAEAGLTTESEFALLICILCFCLLIPVVGVNLYSRRRYKNQLEEYIHEFETKEKGKLVLMEPKPPMQCCYYFVYLVLIIVGAIFAGNVAAIRGRDFWTGCGEL
eukprot:snap_masked-scaffold_17-processed-gene-5.4-mRNA-1 protein AED:1.00 eAED:1.00 QI:0/0/0/0/1/1/3/0/169